MSPGPLNKLQKLFGSFFTAQRANTRAGAQAQESAAGRENPTASNELDFTEKVMPRILLNLTDETRRRVFTDADLERLAALGETVPYNPKTDAPEMFRDLLAGVDAMLTCWGSRSLKPEDFPDAKRDADSPLLVAHAAGSVRGLMPKGVLERGDVRLSQGAAAVAPAVAHLTVAFLALALRQGYARMMALRGGDRSGGSDFPYRDLTGLTIGLVSLSRVAQAVVRVLQTFDCKIIVWDPYWTPERAATLGVELVADLDDLLTRSDAVSLHLPVTPETENLLDARRIALLRPGTVLVNTARGTVLDQNAAFARAMAGEIEYYADVSKPEPLPPDHPAWQSPHIFITPHIAGPTQQTLRRMAVISVEEIERFFKGEPLQHEVTLDRYDVLA
jgi:phosphoglycerate dehydrogenase-like enzyme